MPIDRQTAVLQVRDRSTRRILKVSDRPDLLAASHNETTQSLISYCGVTPGRRPSQLPDEDSIIRIDVRREIAADIPNGERRPKQPRRLLKLQTAEFANSLFQQLMLLSLPRVAGDEI